MGAEVGGSDPAASTTPTCDWGEFVQIHDNRDVFQASPTELPAIDLPSP